MKIFAESYYKGLFMVLTNDLSVKIAEKNGTKTFGKLTGSVNSKACFDKETALKKYNVSEEYLDYFEKNYSKFRLMWNVDHKDHKIGDLYINDPSIPGDSWNLVCHHIGRYRRYKKRAIGDSWKLAVAGLNPKILK